MSADEAIRIALEDHLMASPGQLQTVWEGKTPAASFDQNQPHQKAFLLRAKNQSFGLKDEKTTLHSGIFQVNLCYPSGTGARVVEARGAALQEHFKGAVLLVDGVKVLIRGMPDIASPISITPYVVPVSIRYQSIN